MNRALILGIAFALWTIAAFTAGWQVRDGSADTKVAKTETKTAQAETKIVQAARNTDHADARTATGTEQKRVEASAERETTFNTIEREVVRYVQANPDPAGCDLDGDGLRAWRAANAGSATEARRDDPTGTAGPVPGDVAGPRRR